MSPARISCGITFVFAGMMHLLRPREYEAIMPPYVPAHREMVIISGYAETVGGLAILTPGLERPARWWMIALLIAVFPANLHWALHPDEIKGVPKVPRGLLWARLPFQLAFAWWVVRATDTRE
jgi:uncharacterized membrane protein